MTKCPHSVLWLYQTPRQQLLRTRETMNVRNLRPEPYEILIFLCLDCWMGLREAHDARRAASQASTVSRKNTTGTWSWKDQAGEPREEIDTGDQEECQKWADGSMQNPSQGSSSDEEIYWEILFYENTITGHISADTGNSICGIAASIHW